MMWRQNLKWSNVDMSIMLWAMTWTGVDGWMLRNCGGDLHAPVDEAVYISGVHSADRLHTAFVVCIPDN